MVANSGWIRKLERKVIFPYFHVTLQMEFVKEVKSGLQEMTFFVAFY
jgi:hypothetical protein